MGDVKNNSLFKIPPEVALVTNGLKRANFQAFLVGGCVRDLLLGVKPKDWDITTNARPEQIVATFPKTFYENEFGTVGVVNEDSTDETLKTIEVTPFRIEKGYSDHRHPDTVAWGKTIDDDLKRRDFTINAMAIELGGKVADGYKGHLIDLYKGQEDLVKRTIRSVGDPSERFSEDALRMIRSVRFAAELNFSIEKTTYVAIQSHIKLMADISAERIRDEFQKIIMSDRPMAGLLLLEEMGLLPYVSPELLKTIGVGQNRSHIYPVWEHLLRSVQYAAERKYPLEVRLAALFHDISKPETKRFSRETSDYTFYGHEVIGARVVEKILKNLKFPLKTVEKVKKLVRWHMFFSDTEQITLSAVRRMIRNVGKEYIWDLMDVRVCDRKGMGRPKEDPYRLRKYHAMIEEALHDPISVAMLKINGSKIMEVTRETPGPRIGLILHTLFEEVLDDPKLNTSSYLEERATQLAKMAKKDLESLGEKGKNRKNMEEEAKIKELRSKHRVR
jgi:putative nucleotidyltransferase with HDIG domain